MTPQEFEKIVKDYSENELPEGSALICLHGGANNFGALHGKNQELIATILMIMQEEEDFAKMVRLACYFYDAEGGPEKAESAKTVSEYLDRMGFKKEE